MTENEIDKLVDDRICEMIKENSIKMVQFFICHIGGMAVKANAETLDLSQDSNIGKSRYKIKCSVTFEKLGKAIYKKQNKNK